MAETNEQYDELDEPHDGDDAESSESGEESQDREREEPDWFDEEHLYDDWDELAADPEEVSKLGRALEGILPDVVKRGFDGLVKEDGIRSLVKERELPREAVGFLLGQVDSTKREVLRIVSREVRLFLQNVDLGGELTKILTSVSFEIRTEVRFIPNDASFDPEVNNRVRMRGEHGEEKTLADDDSSDGDHDGESAADEETEETGDDEPTTSDEESTSRSRWGFRRRRDGDDAGDEDDG